MSQPSPAEQNPVSPVHVKPKQRRWLGFVIVLGLTLLMTLVVLLIWPNSPMNYAKIISSMGYYEGRSASSWASDLDHPDEETRFRAASALGIIGNTMGEANVKKLANTLRTDKVARVRSQAGDALRRLGADSAIVLADLEASANEDEDDMVRMTAVMCLLRCKQKARPALDTLKKCCLEERNRTNLGIYQHTIGDLAIMGVAAATMGTDDCIPFFKEILANSTIRESRRVVLTAIGSLEYNSPAIQAVLDEFSASKDAYLATAAKKSLEGLPVLPKSDPPGEVKPGTP